MAEHIKIRPVGGTWVVRAAGAVIGETKNALELSEGDYPAVIYVPRDDIAMAFMEKTDTTSTCPFKGTATYYSIMAKSGEIKNAAWSYEDPIDGMEQISGYLAFYSDKAAVEEV